jgi:hypothetical protein
VVVLTFSLPVLASYDSLLDWASLPESKSSMTAGLASSYDRNINENINGNNDFSQYLTPIGLQLDPCSATVAILTGPGEITRFWMPHLTAKRSFMIKMYFDGETTPRIDTTSNVLLDGQYGYMQGPLLMTSAGGQVLYEPIPFKQSLRIETYNKDLPDTNGWSSDRHYYQYSYHLFSANGPSQSYTGTLTTDQQATRNQVATMLQNLGQNPAGTNPNAVTLSINSQTIPPQTSISLAQIVGSGSIRKLCVKMNQPADDELKGLFLRIRYDGMETPAVDVPVAHFFGAGFGRAAYKSLPLGTDSSDGYYSYWPIPYRRAISIELYNSSAAAITINSAVIEYENRTIAADERYFHVYTFIEKTLANQKYHTLLSLQGSGHYVGNLLWLGSSSAVYKDILEGDDLITADGTTLYGTGLEDAYNSGYYFNWVGIQTDEPEGSMPTSVIRPFHGLLSFNPKYDNSKPPQFSGIYRTDMYRWHIPDVIPFEQSLEVKIENYGLRANIDFGSTAFYYLAVVPGDANGDGTVDIGDLGILAAHYGQNGKIWGQGDFNGDSMVDVGDLGILAAHYAQGSNAANDFNADFARAFSSTATNDDEVDKVSNADNDLNCPISGLTLIAGFFLATFLLRHQD